MRNRSLLYACLVSLVCAVAVSVAGVVVAGVSTENTNDRNNAQWCDLLTPLDRAYSSAVPATELGRRVASAIHRLTGEFGCRG